MNCIEHDELLAKEAAGEASTAESQALRAHEAECADCAAVKAAMASLTEDIDALKSDVPDLPADFHQGWMSRVETEAAMEKKTEQNAPRKGYQVRKLLAWVAAVVLIVGGTALTKDSLLQAAGGGQSSTAKTTEDYVTYDTGDYAPAAYGTDTSNESAPRVYSMSSSYGNGMSAENTTADTAGAEVTDTTKIIRTVNLTLATKAFTGDLQALNELVLQSGGYVSYSSQSGDEGKENRRASLTLRIPATALDEFLNGAAGVGRVTNRTETASDVTASYQDTAARLATQKAKMERLQSLMTTAADLSDLIELENAIADTQYSIDSLQASLNVTDDQVTYATVDVTLKEESAAVAAQARELTLGERLMSALTTGWQSFTGFVSDMCVFLLAALPYIAIVAVLAVLLGIWRKKAKKASTPK